LDSIIGSGVLYNSFANNNEQTLRTGQQR